MRPLVLVAAGLVLVAIDVRTEVLDFVLDPVGWLLVAAAARRLAAPAAAGTALVAAGASLADAFLPSRFVRINPKTGLVDPDGTGPEHLVFDLVTGWRLVALVLAVVAGGIALWLLLRRLEERGGPARPLRLARWAVVGAWVVPYVAIAAVDRDGFDPIWNDGREVLALAGIATLLAIAALLLQSAGRRWALPTVAPLRRLT